MAAPDNPTAVAMDELAGRAPIVQRLVDEVEWLGTEKPGCAPTSDRRVPAGDQFAPLKQITRALQDRREAS
jgi:hypothetical protein